MKEFYLEILKRLRQPQKKENEEVLRIKDALFELKRARNNFDMVVGADNVELAILELNAAEKRYQNLLKEAKENSLKDIFTERLNYDLSKSFE